MKICIQCGQEKPATSAYFAISKECKGGIRGVCKQCANSRSVDRYARGRPAMDVARRNKLVAECVMVSDSTYRRPPKEDLSGRRFGALLVVKPVWAVSKWNWECACDCGARPTVRGNLLKSGQVKCGQCKSSLFKHGEGPRGTKATEYNSWNQLTQRCNNPRSKRFSHYGGRGITVCARWRASYVDFLADMGRKPSPEYSIDRINNDGGYWCGKCEECLSLGRVANCRWATATEQANNKRTNIVLEHNGKRATLSQWGHSLGIGTGTVGGRVRRGWPAKLAVSAPKWFRSPSAIPHSRGETHGASKLSESNVIDILTLSHMGASSRSMAEAFGVDPRYIRSILYGKAWRHLGLHTRSPKARAS